MVLEQGTVNVWNATAKLPAPRLVRCAILFAALFIITANAACSSPNVAVPLLRFDPIERLFSRTC